MTISFPLTAPTGVLGSILITPNPAVSSTKSPFTGDTEVFVHQGQWWTATCTPNVKSRANAEDLIAFLLSLNGPEGTFLLGDPEAETPRGEAGGTPLVAGASQTGQDINIDGCTVDQANWLRKGDWVQFGTGANARLHKSLTDVTSVSDAATLTLWPSVTAAQALADDQAVIVSSTVGLWRLDVARTPWLKRPSIYEVQPFQIISEVT